MIIDITGLEENQAFFDAFHNALYEGGSYDGTARPVTLMSRGETIDCHIIRYTIKGKIRLSQPIIRYGLTAHRIWSISRKNGMRLENDEYDHVLEECGLDKNAGYLTRVKP